MPPVAVAIGVGAAAIGASAYGASQQAKAQKKALSFAEQQAADAKAEQQRLEQEYGLTPGELERESRVFALEKERQTEYQRLAGLSGEELLNETGPITRDLLSNIKSRQGKSGEELFLEEGGLAAKQYYDQVTGTQNEDILKNELELARQMVNQEANRRGVFGGLPEGGIRFEQLGRAGVELAIKSARESLAQKSALASSLINLTSNARAEAGTVAERGLTAKDRARAELDNFLANQENLVQGARGRASNVALGAASITDNANARSYGTITDVYGQQAGRGAAYESAGLGALGEIAGFAISNPSGFGSTAKPARTSIDSEELIDPYQRLSLRTGGRTIMSSRDF